MKSRKSWILIMLCILITVFSCSAMTGAAVKKGLKKEGGEYYYYVKGVPVKNTWKRINGYRYYFGSDGKAYRGHKVVSGKHMVFLANARQLQPGTSGKSFVTHPKSGDLYYMTQAGVCTTGGWFMVGDNVYFADSIGRLKKSCTYQGLTFGANGAVQKDEYGYAKLWAMQTIREITNSSMSKEQKLQACWNYAYDSYTYKAGITRTYTTSTPGWQKLEAYAHWARSGVGDCWSCSCVFAALAAEAGFNPWVVDANILYNNEYTNHVWVMIDNKYYDPEGVKMSVVSSCYGVATYPLNFQLLGYTNYITNSILTP